MTALILQRLRISETVPRFASLMELEINGHRMNIDGMFPQASSIHSSRRWLFTALFFSAAATAAFAEQAQEVSQYGITWKFDKPYTVGQFITGDYWVLGPVNIVSVTPTPGPAPAGEPLTQAKSRYGATALNDDKRMRNGSMIILGRNTQSTTKPAPASPSRATIPGGSTTRPNSPSPFPSSFR